MVTQELADKFAAEWIAAWNTRDLEQILRHYTDDVEFISPFAIKLLNDPAGTVHGKAALRIYFAAGLVKYPGLNFQLVHVYYARLSEREQPDRGGSNGAKRPRAGNARSGALHIGG